MTTFEGSVSFNNMFGHTEDTEMVVDAGKVVQDGEDIDIDLDFEDYGHQDEMMTEEQNEPTYDMVLGDAVTVVEQDEVMIDEDPEEQIYDEEITDAPEEIIEVAELEFIPDAEHVDETQSATNELLNGSDQQRHFITENAEVKAQAIEFQPEPEILPPTIDANLEQHTAIYNSGNDTKTSTKEEVEELITWESEDEEDNVDESEQVKVGDSVEEQQPTELPITELNPVQENEILESVPATLAQENVNTADSDANADADKHDIPNTTIKYDVERNDTAEQPNDDSIHKIVAGDVHGLNTDTHLQSDRDPDNDAHQPRPHGTTIEEQALEQLHPINIRYMDEEMSLFPPTIEEEHTFFFLSEKRLAFDSCENLFKAFREVLRESVTENESLILSCPELGLDIHEGIPETSTLSVAQLLHLHLGLSHNDGHEQPSPMLLVLKHQHDVSGRLNQLYALLNSGKGFSALSGHSLSEQTHGNEYVAEVEEFGTEDHSDDSQSADEAQGAELLSNDDHEIQNGLATPPRENNLEPENEELDFRSPAAVQKNHNPLKLDKANEADTAKLDTQSERDDIAAQHTEIASVQDVIDYNDDDDEEDALEESLTNVEDNDNQSSSLPNVDLSQQATNLETYSIPSVTKDTNHSTSNDGLAQATDNESFHKEAFDLEDPTINPSTSEIQPVNSKEVTGYSGTTIHENTGSDTNHETPVHQETSTTVEAFEEIDYSDDDDQPLPEPEKQASGRQSPKRSFEDSDEPDRDAKKLRSG